MKRLLLIVLALFFIGGTAFSQISFGPKAGFILAKYSQKYADEDMEDYLKFRLGSSVGAVLDLPLCDHVSFQPSAMFSIKGTAHDLKKRSDEHPNHTWDGYDRNRIFYMEIPVNFAGKLDLGPGTIQVFVGPYIAIAVAGRNYYDYTFTNMQGSTEQKGDTKILMRNTVSEEDLNTDGVGGFMRPLDFGFDFGLGYQWQSLLFNVGYNLGIANLTPDFEAAAIEGEDFDPKDYKNTNQGIFFNVAWLFGGE